MVASVFHAPPPSTTPAEQEKVFRCGRCSRFLGAMTIAAWNAGAKIRLRCRDCKIDTTVAL